MNLFFFLINLQYHHHIYQHGLISGSFKAEGNRTPEENELIKLRKENQRLKMENDILKQTALIMGRK